MRIDNFIKNLQKLPLKTRKKAMWIGVLSCSLIIFLFWLFLMPHGPNKKNTSSIDLNEFKKGVSDRISKSGLDNISGDIKEMTEKLNKQDTEDEIITSKFPRLPLVIE